MKRQLQPSGGSVPLPPARAANNSPSAVPVHVLVVDDSSVDFTLLQAWFNRSGLSVISKRVDSPGELDDALTASRWDVVICDYHLPRFSFMQALRQVRLADRDMPLLVVSGTIGEETAVLAMQAGADDYLLKDNLARLPGALARALRTGALRRERREVRSRLVVTLRQLRALFRSAPLGILALDSQGKLVMCNRAVEHVLGWSRQTLLQSWPASVPQALRSAIATALQDARSGGAGTGVRVVWPAANGSARDLLVSAAPLGAHQESPRGIVACVVDESRLHQSERAQRESETRMAAVVANLPGAVFRLTCSLPEMEIQVAYLTGTAAPLLDTDQTDGSAILRCMHPADRAKFCAGIATAAQERTDISEELRIHLKDGASRWFALQASLSASSGSMVAWDGVLLDISARMQAQRELVKLRDNLRALGTHLEGVREEEQARLALDVHDHVGSVLMGMSGDIAWLRRRFINDAEAAMRLDQLASLLDLGVQGARDVMEALRPPLIEEGLVAALEWHSRQFMRQTGIKFEFRHNAELPIGFPERHALALFRVFQEALNNIVKHARTASAECELFVDHENASLEIRDYGQGFLVQRPDETTMPRKRTFGLMGMYERVIAVGGWVEINSIPKAGTTIMVGVPVQEPAKMPVTQGQS